MSANLGIRTAGQSVVSRLARKTQKQLAAEDIIVGASSWWLWLTMAWQDIRQRYRGSVIGPFWLTFSMAIMVGSLGFLYSTIWRIDIKTFLPYFTLGLLFWNLISSLVNDGTTTFTRAEGILLQVRMPQTVHVLRSVTRNLIIFLHNCVVAIAVLAIFAVPQSFYSLVSLIGLALILINGLWFTMLIGMLCTRFRDIGPIVSSFTQIVFFLTPIIWLPEALGNKFWLMYFNPAYVFIEIARGPLLGHTIPWQVWTTAVLVTVAGYLVTFAFFARFRARLPFWV